MLSSVLFVKNTLGHIPLWNYSGLGIHKTHNFSRTSVAADIFWYTEIFLWTQASLYMTHMITEKGCIKAKFKYYSRE